MDTKRFVSLILAVFMALGTASCAKDNGQPEVTTASDNTTSDSAVFEEYIYPSEKFDGYEFTFFSADTQFGCYVRMDFDEQTGDRLDDAVYARNRRVEEKIRLRDK